VEAYQLYLKGMSLFYKRGIHMFDGLKCFEDALRFDPDYALALAGLADSYTMLCLHSYMPPEEAWPKAATAAKRALQIGPDLAEVHSSVAIIAMLFERDWERAEAEFLLAIKLNPRYLQARSWYAVFYLLVVKSDFKEALNHARIGIDYDPLSSYAQTIVSILSSLEGKHEDAVDAGQRAVEFDPESFSAWFFLGYSNHCAGNLSSAIQAYNQAIDISGRHIWALTSLLVLLYEPSEYQNVNKADFIYKELLTKEKTGYVSPFLLAASSAAFGKNEEAISYVKQGLDRHDPLFTNLSPGRPDSKALRAIPEFCKLMESIGLH
jgi:adenylate cyclase